MRINSPVKFNSVHWIGCRWKYLLTTLLIQSTAFHVKAKVNIKKTKMSSKKGAKRSVGEENAEITDGNTSQKRRRIDDKNETKENQTPNTSSKKEETSRKFNESVTEEQRAKHLNGSLYEDAQMLANYCNRSNVAEKDFIMVAELEQRNKNRYAKIETIRHENERILREQNEAFIRNQVVAAIREEIRTIVREEMAEVTRRGIDGPVQETLKKVVRDEVREANQLNETLQFIQLVLFIVIFLFICLKTH